MNQVTQPVFNRIAIVFDFDRTVIPVDSFYALLKHCDIDKSEFIDGVIKPVIEEEDWEHYLARAYYLGKESAKRTNNKITKDKITDLGKTIPLCPGIETLFDRLIAKIQEINSEIDLEFYLISGGFVDIARGTSVAKYFKEIWGCEIHYNEKGEIECMKRQMTHTEKVRYLYTISKGVDEENDKDLIYNYRDIPTNDLYIPLDQIIYIGDGSSDLSCYSAINEYGGISLGVYADDKTGSEWVHQERITRSQRLTNLVPANYKPDSEATKSLFLGLESIANKINLKKMSAGE